MFGHTLKQLRKNHKMSIDNLVEEINKRYNLRISKSMVSRWENDLTDPKMEYVRVIADYFGLSFAAFLHEYDLYDEQIPSHFNGNVDAYEAFKKAEMMDAMSEPPHLPKLTDRQQKTINHYMELHDQESIDKHVDLLFASEGHKDTYKEEYSSESMPYYHIPDYGIQAMAGTGVINGDGMEGTIKVPALPKSDYDYPITVVGDSMEPKYHDGDVIFVKKQNHLEHGEIGIFETENGMVVKKFYNVPEEKVQLISLNEKYSPITEGILRIEGKVVE